MKMVSIVSNFFKYLVLIFIFCLSIGINAQKIYSGNSTYQSEIFCTISNGYIYLLETIDLNRYSLWSRRLLHELHIQNQRRLLHADQLQSGRRPRARRALYRRLQRQPQGHRHPGGRHDGGWDRKQAGWLLHPCCL